MNILFLLTSGVAILATLMVITRKNAVHALLYLIVSLLGVALIFYLLGAPFVAALEVIVYAGAIIVLFLFVVMVLNLSSQAGEQLFELDRPGVWIGPSVMTLILGVELLFTFIRYSGPPLSVTQITPRQVGLALYGPYLLGVEMASMLLLAGLVGAYHLARQKTTSERVGGDE
jgi:NADH-quinone oxidoreductase subunit J